MIEEEHNLSQTEVAERLAVKLRYLVRAMFCHLLDGLK